MPNLPVFYTEFASAAWKRYTAVGYCENDDDDYYYRLWARRNEKPDQNHARRGVIGYRTCCDECERCDCWCNSLYIESPGGGTDEHRDANYAMTDPTTYAPIDVTLADIELCDFGGSPTDCEQWLIDNWGSINPNGEKYSCTWLERDVGNTCCKWQYLGDYAEVTTDCNVRLRIDVTWFFASQGGDRFAGSLHVDAYIDLWNESHVILPALDPDCPCSPWERYSSASCLKGYADPFCSDESATITNDWDCAGANFENGTALVEWDTTPMETPDYYVTTFTDGGGDVSGDFVACETCNTTAAVTAAIEDIKNPAGFVLMKTDSTNPCVWHSPDRRISDIQGIHATGTLEFSGQPSDTNTMTLNDGVHPAVTFEFDDNASVTGENALVTIGANKEATMVNLILAINRAANLDIIAYETQPTADDTCTLRNVSTGTMGNIDIAKSAGQPATITGMEGGLDAADNSGWFWSATLVQSNDGGNTEWKVTATIKDLSHKHDEGDHGGVAGQRYNCAQDRHRHRLFLTEHTQATYNCDSPPASSNMGNEQDCDADGHVNSSDAGEAADWTSCGEGGKVSLVAMWL